MILFNIYGGNFPSYFYMITGFHGAHVLIGVILLGFSFKRVDITSDVDQPKATIAGIVVYPNMLSVDMPAWYWGFVDGVWVLVWGGIYQVLSETLFHLFSLLIILTKVFFLPIKLFFFNTINAILASIVLFITDMGWAGIFLYSLDFDLWSNFIEIRELLVNELIFQLPFVLEIKPHFYTMHYFSGEYYDDEEYEAVLDEYGIEFVDSITNLEQYVAD